MDIFIAVLSGDQSQIMQRNFFSEIRTKHADITRKHEILAICDWSQIIEYSGTGHIIRETGHTNL